MEYEFIPVMPHQALQPSSGPPASSPPRCPYAARRFMDLPASNTPSWQPSPLQPQRWPPHVGPRPTAFSPNTFSDPITNPLNLNYTSPAPLPPPQNANPPPSAGSASAATDSTRENSQASSPQVHVPATHASLGTPSGSGAGSSPLYIHQLGHLESYNRIAATGASGQQPISVRLPAPTGHSNYPRPARPRLPSRNTLSETLRGESSRVTTDGSGPNTSSSDDDSDSEPAPRLRYAAYPHSTRQSQILRGQLPNKRVASKRAVQSLQEVDMATLPENEKSKLTSHDPASRGAEYL